MKIGGRCAPPPGKDLLTVWPGKMPQVFSLFSLVLLLLLMLLLTDIGQIIWLDLVELANPYIDFSPVCLFIWYRRPLFCEKYSLQTKQL
jgi:hypothetical protein